MVRIARSHCHFCDAAPLHYIETVMVKLALTESWAAGRPFEPGVLVSSASIVKEDVALRFADVPEIVPVGLSSLSPAGSVPDRETSSYE